MSQIKIWKKSSPPPFVGESDSRKDRSRRYDCQPAGASGTRQRLKEMEKSLRQPGWRKLYAQRTSRIFKGSDCRAADRNATIDHSACKRQHQDEELSAQVTVLIRHDFRSTSVSMRSVSRSRLRKAATAADKETNRILCHGQERTKERRFLNQGASETKVIRENFDNELLHPLADRRELTRFRLTARRQKIMIRSQGFNIRLLTENGQKVVKINNPEKFWQLSNFLVIEVD